MKRALFPIALLFVVSPLLAAPAVHTQQVLSKTYTIDKIYRSMEGPSSVQRIYLGDQTKPELLWLVGVRTEMVTEDGKTPQLPELMCHVNVDIDPVKHQALFNFKRATATRLVTLSQGMVDAHLPEGFGFPISSNEPLVLYTQVLNHNIEHPKNLQVRHRITFDYIRDSETDGSIKPLFNVGASGMVQLENNPLALTSMMPSAANGVESEEHGANCLIGARAPQAMSSSSDYVDPNGRKMTGHWTVPPGRQVNASDITWFMQLPYDAKVHYAAFHLHPFAESISIRDTTTGTIVMKASAKNPETGIGLTHVDTFASVEGLTLYRNHKYDLVSVYNNTTKKNADSMASAFLCLSDPEFVRPDPADFSKRAFALLDSQTLLVRTSAGDLKAQLFRDVAPSAVMQVARFVQAGIFNGMKLTDARTDVRLVAPMVERVAKNIQPVQDRPLALEAGHVVYCAPTETSNEISVRFVSKASNESFAGCVPFGKLVEGGDIVDAISNAPVGVTAFVGSVAVGR